MTIFGGGQTLFIMNSSAETFEMTLNINNSRNSPHILTGNRIIIVTGYGIITVCVYRCFSVCGLRMVA